MKNFKTALIVLLVSFFANGAFAQSSVILNKKTSRTENNTTISIKFDVDKITSAGQADGYKNKMASSIGDKGTVTSTAAKGGVASYTVTFKRKEWKLERLQNILIAAGLNDVVVDGEKIKTSELAAKFGQKPAAKK